MNTDEYLILVNQTHALANPPDPSRLIAVAPDILLEKTAAKSLNDLIAHVGGQNTIVPVSGYRSHEEQVQIYEDSLKQNGAEFTKKFVALPDCSEHQTGLAIDVGKASENIDFIRPDFPYDGICQRFRQAAPDFGFIQRYEASKQSITGIAEEPWHFRYVGASHARFMVSHHLCLEEYINYLKKEG